MKAGSFRVNDKIAADFFRQEIPRTEKKIKTA